MPMPNKLILLTIFVLSLFLVSPVQAKVITKDKGSVTVAAGEVINDDLFIGAESVDISGTVNGDIYVGAGIVNFSGKVSGDLIIGAGTVNIGQAVIGDSLIIGAGTVNIDEKSKINGSLLVGAGTLSNQAPVGRNFMVAGGMVRLSAPVNGEIRAMSDELELGPLAKIKGDLTYMTGSDLVMDPAAAIAGQTTRYNYSQKPQANFDSRRVWRVVHATVNLFGFFGALVVGLVILWLFKVPAVAVAEKINLKFWPSLGWGLVMLFVVPPTLFLLMMTGIGLPLAAIGGLLFLIDLYVAKIFASLALGKALQLYFSWQKLSISWVFIIGLTVYSIFRAIPIIGWFVRLVALLVGLGGLWLYKRNLFTKFNQR